MYIFSMDNPFFRFVGRLVDLVWLNILTLICCVPVVTAGAAISAMYRILIRMALKEDGTITVVFFRTFKENLKESMIVWVPCLFIYVILGSNAYLVHQGVLASYGRLEDVVKISILIIAIGIFMFLNYYLAIISRYENDSKTNIKNAGLMTIAYFPRSVCIAIIWMFPFALMFVSDFFLFFWWMYGLSIPGFFNSMILGSLFVKTELANNK